MNEELRREFEEWAIDQTWLSFYGQSGDAAWEAWQAARAKQSEIICRKCGLREERGEKPDFNF